MTRLSASFDVSRPPEPRSADGSHARSDTAVGEDGMFASPVRDYGIRDDSRRLGKIAVPRQPAQEEQNGYEIRAVTDGDDGQKFCEGAEITLPVAERPPLVEHEAHPDSGGIAEEICQDVMKRQQPFAGEDDEQPGQRVANAGYQEAD